MKPKVNYSEEQDDIEIHHPVEGTRTEQVHHHVVKVSNL